MTAFVVVHYCSTRETVACVETIRTLDGAHHIVIVDNASPDGSGALLARQYAGAEDVTVLLNGENAGFARGNNLGLRKARETLSAEFAVVLNPDVTILQRDFSERIRAIYARTQFDLLGPDILSAFTGIHQNPKRLQGYTLEQVRQKLAYVRRSQNPVLMLLSSGEKNDPVLWRMVLRRNRARQNIDTDRVWENVVLHGSCVVFSEKFLNRVPEPFYPGTFMYFEMEILDWLCRQCGAVTVYDPSVKVLHQQHAATRVAFRSIVSRSRFVACCLEDSLCAAERLMGGESGEDDEDAARCAVPT